MDELNWLVPRAVIPWLTEWGAFLGALAFLLAAAVLGLRKFFLWRRGTTEILVYLKRLTELQEKSLIELEMLNRTLKMPLKKAKPAAADEPRPVSQKEKENLLSALQAARDQIGR